MRNLKKLYRAIHNFRVEIKNPKEYDEMKTIIVNDVFRDLDLCLVESQQKILDMIEKMEKV